MKCRRCRTEIQVEHGSRGTFAQYVVVKSMKVCYSCCADVYRKRMDKDGEIMLYYSVDSDVVSGKSSKTVANWGSSIRFPVSYTSKGKHNWRGVDQLNFWFKDGDKWPWYGKKVGEADLCRCKQLKLSFGDFGSWISDRMTNKMPPGAARPDYVPYVSRTKMLEASRVNLQYYSLIEAQTVMRCPWHIKNPSIPKSTGIKLWRQVESWFDFSAPSIMLFGRIMVSQSLKLCRSSCRYLHLKIPICYDEAVFEQWRRCRMDLNTCD